MALKTILNKQTDFTGEFPEEWAKGGLWRFNESDPDEDDCLLDSSGMGRAWGGWHTSTTGAAPARPFPQTVWGITSA